MDQERLPVTIITGFLGAGKTSLLNQLIKKHPEKKFAIIENEFGETGIDGGLIAAASDAIFELNNGCICCSLGDDFLQTLENLLGSSYEFNHLLIETTGIADPSAIIDAFISGSTIQQKFRIDSVVCVADAVNMEDLIDTQPEIRKQIALADLLLINKTDSVPVDYLPELTSVIRGINPLATIYPTTFGQIAELEVLDTFSFSGKSIEESNNIIELDAPVRAEDPALVPLKINTKIKQSNGSYIKKILVLVDKNPFPFVGEFEFTPYSGKADLAMRIRERA